MDDWKQKMLEEHDKRTAEVAKQYRSVMRGCKISIALCAAGGLLSVIGLVSRHC